MSRFRRAKTQVSPTLEEPAFQYEKFPDLVETSTIAFAAPDGVVEMPQYLGLFSEFIKDTIELMGGAASYPVAFSAATLKRICAWAEHSVGPIPTGRCDFLRLTSVRPPQPRAAAAAPARSISMTWNGQALVETLSAELPGWDASYLRPVSQLPQIAATAAAQPKPSHMIVRVVPFHSYEARRHWLAFEKKQPTRNEAALSKAELEPSEWAPPLQWETDMVASMSATELNELLRAAHYFHLTDLSLMLAWQVSRRFKLNELIPPQLREKLRPKTATFIPETEDWDDQLK